MTDNEMCAGWLTSRARKLRAASKSVEGAYRTDPMKSLCWDVAIAYHEAALLLETAAQELLAGGANGATPLAQKTPRARST